MTRASVAVENLQPQPQEQAKGSRRVSPLGTAGGERANQASRVVLLHFRELRTCPVCEHELLDYKHKQYGDSELMRAQQKNTWFKIQNRVRLSREGLKRAYRVVTVLPKKKLNLPLAQVAKRRMMEK